MIKIRDFMEAYGIGNSAVNDEFRQAVVTLVEKLQTYEYRVNQEKTETFIDDFFDNLFPMRVEFRQRFLRFHASKDKSVDYLLPMVEFYFMTFDEWKRKGEKTSPDAFAHTYALQCYNRLANTPYHRRELPLKGVTDVELRLFIKRTMQAGDETPIERDEYLLNLFKRNVEIYDKFLERCKDKKNISIVNELLAALKVLHGEENAINKSASFNFKNIQECLKSIGLAVAEYSSFAEAFEYKSKRNYEKRKAEIGEARKEYKKILD